MEIKEGFEITTEESINFIKQLMKEYKEQKIKLSLVGKELFSKLEFLDGKILSSKQEKKENLYYFSPHAQKKKEKINDLQDQIKEVKKEINVIDREVSNIEQRMKCLSAVINKINPERKRCNDFSYEDEFFQGRGLYFLEMQEEDRQRISMELHDSTVQTLTGMLHRIELCSRLIDMDKVRAKLELSTMSSTLREVIDEMRDIVFDLRPLPHEDISFLAAVERLVSQLNDSSTVNIFINSRGKEPDNILNVIKITLYRVIEEAFTNAIRHSQANEININLSFSHEKIYIEIIDNGIGFDIASKQESSFSRNSGFGLSIMKKRICLLSGKFKLQSHVNEGTKISISVPIGKNKGDG